MIQRGPKIADLRVAVVTASSASEDNNLWYAASELVGALRILGSDGVVPTNHRENHTLLREVDLGKGLIWRHLVGLRKRIRDFEADVIHVNGELWSVTSQQLLRLEDSAVVVHGAENLWWHGSVLESRLRMVLIRKALNRLSGYASWNESGARFISERAAPGLPILTLPAVIPPPAFRRDRWHGATGRGDGWYEILLAGRVVREKGFQNAIEATSRLLAKHKIRVVVCGDGPYLRDLAVQSRALNVPIEFCGTLSAADLASRMSHASVLIQPSLTTRECAEQFGRTVAEAMTIGLPCVVSTCGELPKLVGFSSKALFPEGDSVALATVLDHLLTDGGTELISMSIEQRRLSHAWEPSPSAQRLVEFWRDASRWHQNRGPASLNAGLPEEGS